MYLPPPSPTPSHMHRPTPTPSLTFCPFHEADIVMGSATNGKLMPCHLFETES